MLCLQASRGTGARALLPALPALARSLIFKTGQAGRVEPLLTGLGGHGQRASSAADEHPAGVPDLPPSHGNHPLAGSRGGPGGSRLRLVVTRSRCRSWQPNSWAARARLDGGDSETTR